eukprot:11181814-Lingulodinium_polyedra.AAC.1
MRAPPSASTARPFTRRSSQSPSCRTGARARSQPWIGTAAGCSGCAVPPTPQSSTVSNRACTRA